MNKEDVIKYVMESPYNTNRAVLSDILDNFVASDNKEEIELTATENKVYIPDEGKVYKKVTVDIPVTPAGGELVKANVDIAIDAGDYEATWSLQETKRFADIIEEIEEGNIVILVGWHTSSFWGIFVLTEKTDSLLRFEHMDAPFKLSINSDDTMVLTYIS